MNENSINNLISCSKLNQALFDKVNKEMISF